MFNTSIGYAIMPIKLNDDIETDFNNANLLYEYKKIIIF